MVIVFTAKAIHYLDTKQCQQYQNLYTSQNMDISQPEQNNGWTRVSYKSIPAQEEYQGDVKHTKESNHWLHPTSTALLDEENRHQQQQDRPGYFSTFTCSVKITLLFSSICFMPK
jgi:hypothetical protein